jgi:hypothetical protein
MKYRKIETYESNILDGWGAPTVAKRVGCSAVYITYLKQGKRIATYEFYQRLVTALKPTLEEPSK